MSNILKRYVLIFVVCCLALPFVFCGCGSGRDYCEDINVRLEERDAELIIREWTFLLGSGAEIYYKTDDDEILLGQLAGGDDGFCPFKEGLYSVSVDEGELTIEWSKFPNGEKISWEKETFTLPD